MTGSADDSSLHIQIPKLPNYKITRLQISLSLCQWDMLRRAAAYHVLDLDRIRRDVNDFVAAVYNVAFARDKNVLAFGQKDFPGLAGLIGKAEELKRNRRRR